MKLLHLTDTHLGTRRWVRGAPPGWSRADDHERALVTALQPALRGEVDLVVHSGDLFDRSSPPARAVHRAARLLSQAARRVPVVVMPGNHDRHGLSRHLPVPPPGLHVVDRPARLEIAGLALAVVPFRRSAEAWADDARRATRSGCDLLVAHQAFHGARVPGLVFRVGMQRDTIGARHLPSGVRHLLCGHLHPRQVLQVGGAEIVCPGATERTAFSERHQVKGYALWSLGRTVQWSFVDLPSRPLVDLRQRTDLGRVRRGTLVRLRCPAVSEAEVAERGGWLVARSRRGPRSLGPPAQPSLFDTPPAHAPPSDAQASA